MTDKDKRNYAAKAKIFKALAHPTRLWMTEQLRDGERCVCDFVDAVKVDFSTISKHLSVLKEAGIVADDKRGKQVFYSLKVPCILNSMSCIDGVLQKQIEEQSDLLK